MDTVIRLVRLQSISGQIGKPFINKDDRERERIEEEIKSNTVQTFFHQHGHRIKEQNRQCIVAIVHVTAALKGS